MKTLIVTALLLTIGAPAARGATIDRIAAIVERQALTVSEVSQMVEIRFFPRQAGEGDDDYHRRVLDALIAQTLRLRDVERFGAQDVSKDSIEARLREMRERFPTPAEFDAALARTELTLDETRALVRRQLQVEAYIRERFLPLVFVSSDDIEAYYRETWAPQRRTRGLDVPQLPAVRDEIRTALKTKRLDEEIERWTTQLRARANVDILAWR